MAMMDLHDHMLPKHLDGLNSNSCPSPEQMLSLYVLESSVQREQSIHGLSLLESML